MHIPFCVSRCLYCAFCSSTRLSLRERYVAAVIEEYALRHDYLRGEAIETIYFGGGTPSVLTAAQLSQLFAALPVRDSSVVEATMECNPDDITPAFVQHIKAHGINRVSLGIQTFSDERLRFLRRRHTAQQAREAVRVLRQEGIANISVDLMFGFPNETTEEWQHDISSAVALGVEHISAYSLMYEEGTALYTLLQRGSVEEIDEERSREMYYLLLDALAAHGYEHYEISNFCRKGYRAQHNSNYWREVPYLGIGAAAHSYDHHARQWNTDDIEAYIVAIARGEIPCEREPLSPDTRYNDMITTALRTKEGIDLSSSFHNKDYLLAAAQPFLARHLMAITDQHLHLTRDGLYIADSILCDLVKV